MGNVSEWILLLAAMIFAVLLVALYVWTSRALVSFFRQAGEPVGKAWVPILSLITVLRLRRQVRAAALATAVEPSIVAADTNGSLWLPPEHVRTPETSLHTLTRQGWPSEEFDDVSAIAGAPVPKGVTPILAQTLVDDTWELELPESGLADGVRRSRGSASGWVLTTPAGEQVPLAADIVLVGRRPKSPSLATTAQTVSVADDTMTVSKTHARLERDGDGWTLTDLGSTNGTRLVSRSDAPTPINGVRLGDGEQFLLGDAAFTVRRV